MAEGEEKQADLEEMRVGGPKAQWLFGDDVKKDDKTGRVVLNQLGTDRFEAFVKDVQLHPTKEGDTFPILNLKVNDKDFMMSCFALKSEQPFNLGYLKGKKLTLQLDGRFFYVEAVEEAATAASSLR